MTFFEILTYLVLGFTIVKTQNGAKMAFSSINIAQKNASTIVTMALKWPLQLLPCVNLGSTIVSTHSFGLDNFYHGPLQLFLYGSTVVTMRKNDKNMPLQLYNTKEENPLQLSTSPKKASTIVLIH